MEEVQIIKIIVVGDANVGKTSLLSQYCWSVFDINQSPTIGCDFQTKTIQRQGTHFKLQLWDIAGQEKFQSVSRLFIRGASGCLVVSDIQDYQSIQSAVGWKHIVEGNSEHQGQLPIFFIQNKIDLIKDKQPKEWQTKEWLTQFGEQQGFTKSYQASVKDCINLEQIIDDLIQEMLDKKLIQMEDKLKTSFFLSQSEIEEATQRKKKKQCC